MRQFLLKCVIYFVSIFLVVNGIAMFCDAKIRDSSIFKPNVIINQDSLAGNVILGSSRALTGIDSKLLGKLTGRKWYNISIDDTPVETHLLLYELLVSAGKTPDVLLLQYDKENSRSVNEIHEKDYQFMPFSYVNKEIRNHLLVRESGWAYEYIPVVKYTTFNTELVISYLRLLWNKNYRHRFDENGDYTYPAAFSYRSECIQPSPVNLNFHDPSLSKIAESCRKNGTRLILFTAPYRCREVVSDTDISTYLNYSSTLRSDSCFSDEQHLNPYGRKLFTEIIGRDLNQAITQ